MSSLQNLKVAIVHDWLTNQGGAENVVTAMSDLFPDAPIFTSVYVPGAVPSLDGRDIRCSWLQKLPKKLRKSHQKLLPLLPSAFASFDLSSYDVILSSSSSFAKCIKKSNKAQIHICYCHTPVRYLYHARDEYIATYPLPAWLAPVRAILPKLLDFLERRDQKAAKEVDYFIANSQFVADRIARYYQSDATIINPCVDVTQFSQAKEQGDYYMALGRFVPYKKFDLLVETFIKNGLPLKLVGTGVDLEKCQQMAAQHNASNIEFTGYAEQAQIIDYYRHAKAFLFPAEEDFGLTPVEAMASGLPVIAYGKGGAAESVNTQCGVFFYEQTASALQGAIDEFEQRRDEFSQADIMARAAMFDNTEFQRKLAQFIEKCQSKASSQA